MLPRTSTATVQALTNKVELARGYFGVVFKCLYTGNDEQILKLTSPIPEQRYLILKEAKPPEKKNKGEEPKPEDAVIQQFIETITSKSEPELLQILSDLNNQLKELSAQKRQLDNTVKEAKEITKLIDDYYTKTGTISDELAIIIDQYGGVGASTNNALAQRIIYDLKMKADAATNQSKAELKKIEADIVAVTNKFVVTNDKIQARRTYQNEIEIISHIQQRQDQVQPLFAKGAVMTYEDGSQQIASEFVYHTADSTGFHTANLENYLKMFRDAHIPKSTVTKDKQAPKKEKSPALECAMIELLQQFGEGIHNSQHQLHQLGLLHLDTHGGNFMIGTPEILADGKLSFPLKIIDFGLSKKMTPTGEIRSEVATDLSRELIPERYDRAAKFATVDGTTGKSHYVRSIHTDLYTKKVAIMEMIAMLAGVTFDKLLAESVNHSYNSAFRKNLTDEDALKVYMNNLKHYINALPNDHQFKNVLGIYATQMEAYLTTMPDRSATLTTIIDDDHQLFMQAMSNVKMHLTEYRESLPETPENAVLLDLLLPKTHASQQKTPAEMETTSTEKSESRQTATTDDDDDDFIETYQESYGTAEAYSTTGYKIESEGDSATTPTVSNQTASMSQMKTSAETPSENINSEKLSAKIDKLITKIKDPGYHNQKVIAKLAEKLDGLIEKIQPLKTENTRLYDKLYDQLQIAKNEIKLIVKTLETQSVKTEANNDSALRMKSHR